MTDPTASTAPSGPWLVGRIDAALRPRLAEVAARTAALRRRLWAQAALDRLVLALAAASLVASVAALLVRTGWTTAETDAWWLTALGALLAVGALAALLVRPGLGTAARLLDRRGGGADRATTAWALALLGRDDAWARVQAAQANAWAANIDVPALAPWRRPRLLPGLVVGTALTLAAALAPTRWLEPFDAAPVPAATQPGLALATMPPPPAFESARDLLTDTDLDMLAADRELLDDVIDQTEDPAVRTWLESLREVVTDVEEGRIDRTTALSRLDELDKLDPTAQRPRGKADDQAAQGEQGAAADNQPAGDNSAKDPATGADAADTAGAADPSDPLSTLGKEFDDTAREAMRDRAVRKAVSDALAEAEKALPKGVDDSAKDELKEAVKDGDLDRMSRWLEKMAERDMSDKELEGWMKFAEKFADKLADKKIPKRFEKLAERVRRLQKKRRDQGGLTAAEQRRLKDSKASLRRLAREQGDMPGAKHQVRRLERGSRQAVDELRRQQRAMRRMSKAERAKEQAAMRKQMQRRMRQAADELRRQHGRQANRQAGRIGRSRARDLRETLERSGRRAGGSREDFERRARQQRTARAGQQGQQGKPGQQRKPGQRGQQGKPGQQGQQGKPGQHAKAGQRGKPGSQGGAGDDAAARAAERDAQRRREARLNRSLKKRFKLGRGKTDAPSRMEMMRRGYGKEQPGGGSKPGDGSGGQQTAGQPGGSRPGKGTAPMGDGQREALGAARTERVKGVQNDGPSVKQVFVDVAKRGFARQRWEDLHTEYSEVAEEALESGRVPPGRARTVRRYYELIRPRVEP